MSSNNQNLLPLDQIQRKNIGSISSRAILRARFEFFELIGFPLCSPFQLLQEDIPEHHTAADIPRRINKTIHTYGYLVSLKNSKSASGQAIAFGMFYDM